MPGTLELRDIDLSDPELYATGDPHAVWTHLRATAPVFFQEHAYGARASGPSRATTTSWRCRRIVA